jgi:hypothetical protein
MKLRWFCCALALVMMPAAFAALDECNVVWDSPSRDSYDSMPLSGSRGAGANFWFQDGALWFYPGHSGAQDENSCLLKLGALRLTPERADFKSPKRFRQELDLPSGSIRIEAEAQDGTTLDARLWFAGDTLVVELKTSRELSLLAEYASWRAKPNDAPTAREQVTPKDGTLLFGHRNGHCERAFSKAKAQSVPESALVNPAQNRVFGGVLAARGGLKFAAPVPVQWQIWKGHAWPAKTVAAKEQVLTVALGAAQNADPAQWAARANKLLEPAALAKAKADEQQRWDEFWGRSHVFIRPGGDPEDPVAQMGRNYQRYRYMAACNQGGELPLRFNGGIFCSDPRIERVPERLNNLGTLSFSRGANPDFMRWGSDIFFGQNQRWMGWPTLANGDADLLRPCIAYYRDRLPTAQARARNLKAAGACYIETLDLEGLCSVTPTSQGLSAAPHITYHFSMGLEHAWMTLRGRSVSGTDLRADLPWMVEQIRFVDSFYRGQTKTRTGKELTPDGKLSLYPCNGLELTVKATNPIETVAALRAVVSALLELPELSIADREFLKLVQPTLPGLPVAEKNGQKILNLADRWEGLANGWEFPEMFPAWPYRLVGVLHPETLPLCCATWDSQELRGDNQQQAKSPWEKGGQPGGPGPLQKRDWSWQSTTAYAAALGLTGEAAQYAVTKLSDRASACRFPAFFGPGHDWMPDIEWGGSASTGLQEMLLACDETKILLLPAWPSDWDVDFKLHAPRQTTVECVVKQGKIVTLKITPESRRKDVELPSFSQ